MVCACIMAGAVAWVYQSGGTLRFGDAEAHLNIARRIIDSRTPGWDQVGTTWLPLPHLLMLPLVRIDRLWQTGLAGAIPAAFCTTLAATFLFAAVRRIFSTSAGGAAAGVFLLNPNSLYLGSTPMTEACFFCCLFALLYFTVLFAQNQRLSAVALAGFAAFAGTLTRYEAWILLPFAALYILIVSRDSRWRNAIVFSAIAGLGPLLWFAHNWWYFRDALEFYHGPYSALAIQGKATYPGKGDWYQAFHYFFEAGKLVCGPAVLVLGTAGVVAALAKRALWPVILLALPPLFYVWSMHSSGAPIFIPTLFPHTYYNTRYALALLPLAALGCAGLASLWKPLSSILILASLVPFLLHPTEPPITWKESDENSRVRLEWTRQVAQFLKANAAPSDTYFTGTGDMTGIYRTMGVHLRRTLTGDMGPEWVLATTRPELFLHDDWAIATGGDIVQSTIDKARLPSSIHGPRYDLAARFYVKGGPVIEVYQRARKLP